MNDFGFVSLARDANEAAADSYKEKRIEIGESQKDLASELGKGNCHISRMEKRPGSLGSVVATNHSTGHPGRSFGMVRSAHEALERESIVRWEGKSFEEAYGAAKRALDSGPPCKAYGPALACKHIAETDDQIVIALNLIGNCYREDGEPAEAIRWYSLGDQLAQHVKDCAIVYRVRINIAGALRLLGSRELATFLVERLAREPLAAQQRGFLLMEMAFLAEERRRNYSAGRCFRLAQKLFEQVGNGAYAATAKARALRVQLLYGGVTTRARARERMEELMKHDDSETKGLAITFNYEAFGRREDLREAEHVAKRAPATVRDAIARAKARRRGGQLRGGAAAAVALLLTLLPTLICMASALAKADSK